MGRTLAIFCFVNYIQGIASSSRNFGTHRKDGLYSPLSLSTKGGSTFVGQETKRRSNLYVFKNLSEFRKRKKYSVNNLIFFPFFIFITFFISLNCKKEQINWTKVDPKFNMELDGKNYTENSIISAILKTEGHISDMQKEKLLQKEIQVLSIAGTIATVQFPLRSLPFLTNQTFILFISKPTIQKLIN